MNRKITLWFFIITLFLAIRPDAAWSLTIYVTTDEAKIFLHPSVNTKIVATVLRGGALSKLGSVGGFYKVKTKDGKRGYILQRHASTTRPENKDSDGLTGLLDAIEPDRTASLDEEETGHSIRGLKSSEDGGEAKPTGKQARGMVNVMEKLTVGEEELKDFRKEGKLGEYAR